MQHSRSDQSFMREKCLKCHCQCDHCFPMHSSLDLHGQIEELRSELSGKIQQFAQLQAEYELYRNQMDGEVTKQKDENNKMREKYDRLLDGHRKLQSVNHLLEDKLLHVVSETEREKVLMQEELGSLTNRLVESKALVSELELQCDQYRSDCNLAVHLLECKPSEFISRKLSTFPSSVRNQVPLMHQAPDEPNDYEPGQQESPYKIHLPTFPPTALFYSNDFNGCHSDSEADSSTTSTKPSSGLPLNIVAQILKKPELKRTLSRNFVCVRCRNDVVVCNKGTQYEDLFGGSGEEKARESLSATELGDRRSFDELRFVHSSRSRKESTSFESVVG